VRYVSHEIRTPLNTAILGLQLLEKEVQKLFIFPTRESSNTQRMVEKSDKKLKSLLVELVADTHQACNVSVEILNDLLMYEKIDGGLLVLDANEVLVVPFVKEALQMFVVQVSWFVCILLRCLPDIFSSFFFSIGQGIIIGFDLENRDYQ